MINWYRTKEGISGVRHRGVLLEGNKCLKMRADRAKIHNKVEEKLTMMDKPPKTILDCQFPDDFHSSSTSVKPNRVLKDDSPKQT